MTPPRCSQCRTDLTRVTLSGKDGEFARRWKCCTCGATANAGMVHDDLNTRPTLLGTYPDYVNAER